MRFISFATAAFVSLTACAVERTGYDPPRNDLYHPTGVAVHPNGGFAYVVNANTDLRYNAGTVTPIDLNAIVPEPNRNPNDPYNIGAVLAGETQLIDSHGAFPILNGDGTRMFVGTREKNVLYAFEVIADGGGVRCGAKGRNRFTTCDDDHTFALSGKIFSDEGTENDTSQPFIGVVAKPVLGFPGEYLFLTHLNAGAISVYDITPNALTPNPNGFLGVTLLGQDRLGAIVNGTSAIGVTRGPNRQPMIYAGSSRVLSVRPPGSSSTLFFFDPQAAVDVSAQAGAIALQRFLGGNSASIDVKYITSSPNGERTYFLTREPNALVSLDTSLDADGRVKNRFVDVLPLERAPATMVYVPGNAVTGARDLLYVSCYGDGSVLIFDAATLTLVGKHRPFERGPYSLAVSSVLNTATGAPLRTWVLATYFNDDALLIFDAADPDPSRHTIYARIGTPRESKLPK